MNIGMNEVVTRCLAGKNNNNEYNLYESSMETKCVHVHKTNNITYNNFKGLK